MNSQKSKKSLRKDSEKNRAQLTLRKKKSMGSSCVTSKSNKSRSFKGLFKKILTLSLTLQGDQEGRYDHIQTGEVQEKEESFDGRQQHCQKFEKLKTG